jgi:hypothetical protein
MADMANIVAYDGADTPAAHTYVPVDTNTEKGVTTSIWREQVANLPFYAQGTVTMKKQKLPSGVHRVSVRVEVPVMESVSGQNAAGYTAAPKVAYTDTVESVSFFSERSTIGGRRLARMLLTNILNNVATSVAAATTGPAVLLVDTNVSPT